MTKPTKAEIDAAAERVRKLCAGEDRFKVYFGMPAFAYANDKDTLSKAYLAGRLARAERDDDEPPVPYIELNMSNYDDDEVSQLNEWAIWAVSRIEQLENEAT